ncbi:MAG: LLM class F420-dependent oxidoreductase [Chloroflexi bacterium]|nr:LLM class F420-dependent oxidoreductase [Chloroflexota bacterium]
MQIGLQIPNFTWPGGTGSIAPRLADIARTADEAGFYSLWVMDHFFQIAHVGQIDEPMLEGYTTLGYLAGVTRKVRLGTLVTGVIYRHPAVLLKDVTTLDVLSGGRAYLGIGAAWNEREALGLGIPFPALKERFERLEETLQIARQLWSGDTTPFHGKYTQLAEPIIQPQPLSRPHPPILIGGTGEQKTLRLVARYADACNLFARLGDDVLTQKLDVLKRHCDEIGRDYNEIERTCLATVHLAPGQETPAQMIELCRSMHRLGFQHMIVNMPNISEIRPLETIAREVIPVVSGW